MNIHNLESIFNPKRIALIGITTNPNSVSGKVLINLVSGGFRGVVYPVNPDHEAVMGIPCFPDIKSLPKTPDLGIICTPSEKVPGIVRECGEAGIRGLIIMSAGFKEVGEEGRLLEGQIREEQRKFDRHIDRELRRAPAGKNRPIYPTREHNEQRQREQFTPA